MFDLNVVPFSRHLSYLGISRATRTAPPGLYIRHLRGSTQRPEIFKIELIYDGQAVAFTESTTPSLLRLEAEVGYVEFCFVPGDIIRVRGTGVTLRLTLDTSGSQFDNAYSPDGKRWEVIAYEGWVKVSLVPLAGELRVDAPWEVDRSPHIVAEFSGQFEAAVHAFTSERTTTNYTDSFDSCVEAAQTDYERWLAATLPVPSEYTAARALAAYINWSCVVAAEGNLARPAMFMSKNWMNKIWNWDNCFNALALAEQDPTLAWDQIMLFVDHQNEQGALPDHLTDSTRSFRFYKPPVHGWTVRELMKRTDHVTRARLEEIYEPLVRWTEWWFTYRDDDHDGLPQYNHGNESGWDNGTTFGEGVPVESPDLAAYLVIQMDVLADIAGKLDKQAESTEWGQRADCLMNKLIQHFWNGDQFVAKRSGSHEVPQGDSLLVYIPLILGDRLPEDIKHKLVTGLSRFITENGPATENPQSDMYKDDGYWRGPIWAPSTYLIVEGLLACGQRELALDICTKFCKMAATNGMAENYDAQTGVGLRDRAYTWTSSVFLLLANLLLD